MISRDKITEIFNRVKLDRVKASATIFRYINNGPPLNTIDILLLLYTEY